MKIKKGETMSVLGLVLVILAVSRNSRSVCNAILAIKV